MTSDVRHPEATGLRRAALSALVGGEPLEEALLELALLLPVDRQKQVRVHGVLQHIMGSGG